MLNNLFAKIEDRERIKTRTPSERKPNNFRETDDPYEADKVKIKDTTLDITTSKDILFKTTNYLFNEDYLDPSTDVPIASGYKRYIVNTEPQHKHGREFVQPEELDCGLYLETHNGTPESYKYAQKLMEQSELHKNQLTLLEKKNRSI